MKTLVGVLIAVFSLSAETAFAQPQPSEPFGLSGLRIAFFSPQRAFSDSDDGKAGLARLKALDEKRGREVEERTNELRKREEALKAGLGMLSVDGQIQQTREIEKFRLDVDRFIEDAQVEFLAVRREIESAFLVRLRPIMEQLARDKKLDLILNADTEMLLWADRSVDITSEVVKQLAAAVPARPGFN
jgi:Skp family chaperone for outer membrane proteins